MVWQTNHIGSRWNGNARISRRSKLIHFSFLHVRYIWLNWYRKLTPVHFPSFFNSLVHIHVYNKMRTKPVRNSGMGSSHCLKLLVVFALGCPGSELSKHDRKPCPTFHSWRGKRGSGWGAESVPGDVEDSHWELSLYWLRCPFSEMEKS